MVASFGRDAVADSSPTEIRCLVTTPSNGAVTLVIAQVGLGDGQVAFGVLDVGAVGVALGKAMS